MRINTQDDHEVLLDRSRSDDRDTTAGGQIQNTAYDNDDADEEGGKRTLTNWQVARRVIG